jgi:hypothetical protein
MPVDHAAVQDAIADAVVEGPAAVTDPAELLRRSTPTAERRTPWPTNSLAPPSPKPPH